MPEVFERKEIKYMVSAAAFPALRQRLEPFLRPDAHSRDGAYTIMNLYMDTDDDWFIRHSLRKPRYKEKLRLRGYGVPENGDAGVYLEIKKKVAGVVSKRRIGLPLREAMAYLTHPDPATLPPDSRQVGAEIDWMLRCHPTTRPRVFLAYDRLAFTARDDPSVRLTFDEHIRTRRDRLALDAGDDGEELLPPGQRLMEVKVAGGMPLWLAHALSDFHLAPVSFSKYGAEYTLRFREQLEKEASSCCKSSLPSATRPCPSETWRSPWSIPSSSAPLSALSISRPSAPGCPVTSR